MGNKHFNDILNGISTASLPDLEESTEIMFKYYSLVPTGEGIDSIIPLLIGAKLDFYEKEYEKEHL